MSFIRPHNQQRRPSGRRRYNSQRKRGLERWCRRHYFQPQYRHGHRLPGRPFDRRFGLYQPLSNTISVGSNANILANADSTYTAGDVSLNASADYESNWASITPFFQNTTATASVGISDGDVIKGNNVSIDTLSDSSKKADFIVDNDALPATINSLPSTSQTQPRQCTRVRSRS